MSWVSYCSVYTGCSCGIGHYDLASLFIIQCQIIKHTGILVQIPMGMKIKRYCDKVYKIYQCRNTIIAGKCKIFFIYFQI